MRRLQIEKGAGFRRENRQLSNGIGTMTASFFRLKMNQKTLFAATIGFFAFLTIQSSTTFGQAASCDKVFKNPAETAAFKSNEPWGPQLFDRQLLTLEDFFVSNQSLSAEKQVDLILEKDVRKSFFRLQLIAKTYREQDDEFFSPLRDAFKKVEDRIGRVDLKRQLKEQAASLQEQKLADFFSREEDQSRKDLISALKEIGLLQNARETIAQLKQKLHAFNWKKPTADRDFVIQFLRNHVKALKEQIEADQFNNEKIEKGLHELRRQLRWIPIQLQALDGLVAYVKTPSMNIAGREWLKEIQDHHQSLGPLPSSTEKILTDKPILFPWETSDILHAAIKDIGALKDKAEVQAEFSIALEAIEPSATERSRIMAKVIEESGGQIVDHRKLAIDYELRIMDSAILDTIETELKKSLSPQ